MTATHQSRSHKSLTRNTTAKQPHAAESKAEKFFESPHWVVLALCVLVGVILAISDITTSAFRSINDEAWSDIGYFSIATILSVLFAMLALNYFLPTSNNKFQAVDENVLETYRLPRFLASIFIGLAITSLIDMSPLGHRIISIWEAFPGISGFVVTSVLISIFIILFVIGNYVSYLFQTLAIQRDSISQTVSGFVDINDRIADAQLAIRRQFSEFIHGEVQGRLLYITSLIRQGKISHPEDIAQHLDDLIENSVRPLAHRMYPSEIVISVMSALDTLCGDAVHWTATDSFAALDVVGTENCLTLSQREAIYFVCLEGVNNALKHGEVGSATLTLDVDGDFATIQIKNKIASPSKQVRAQENHNGSFGLRTIDSWVARSNGKWQLTEEGDSFTLNASVSLTHE
jgi:two-component sensor histidine kinase